MENVEKVRGGAKCDLQLLRPSPTFWAGTATLFGSRAAAAAAAAACSA
jgi:hypothetical protein